MSSTGSPLVGILNTDTGQIGAELPSNIVFAVKGPERKGIGANFAMLIQNAALELATAEWTNPIDYQVMFALLGTLEMNNSVQINVTKLAQTIGKSRPTVSLSVGRLVDHGVLLRDVSATGHNSYLLDPEFGWRGDARGHSFAVNEKKVRARKLAA